MAASLFKAILWFGFLIAFTTPTLSFGQESAPIAPTRVFQPGDSNNFLSFENARRPGNRIGYRLHEHLPLVAGAVPTTAEEAALDPVATARRIEAFRSKPGVFVHTREVTEDGWKPQLWTFYFAPVETGFEVLWVIETRELGLESFYSAQQCFRMTGKTNEAWRRAIAETPDFSEYDHWSELAKNGKVRESLSWVRRNSRWEGAPAVERRLVCRTPIGKALEEAGGLNSRRLLEILDPKHDGEVDSEVESGLLARTNPAGTWVCGLYWEGTTHVSNHHPADCLHAIVNLGPIPPRAKRAVRGRIYWMNGTKEELYNLWRNEFPAE